MSVGTIRGGSKVNIVPDFCEAAVDIRTVPSQNTAFYHPPHFGAPARGLSRSGSHRRAFSAIAHGSVAQNHPPARKPRFPCVGAPWFCDAAVFARDGTPAIALGPGSIAQAHTRDEWIGVENLERGAEFFARFLRLL